ncbi:hypothetical protein M513_13948, partial [Trichuris suis]
MAMFPIRCVVETVGDGQCTKCSVSGAVLVDSYAIVSGFTQLSQLVDTVLMALGLQHLSYGAQGRLLFFVDSMYNLTVRARSVLPAQCPRSASSSWRRPWATWRQVLLSLFRDRQRVRRLQMQARTRLSDRFSLSLS